MKILIIEDEIVAVQKLTSMLKKIGENFQIVATLESVKQSIDWIKNNPSPDLAFMDVQLSDDSVFEIFKKIEINFPVVFTTAYDQYILRSFEYNSIDYLLKPIEEDRLNKAIEKVKKLADHFVKFNLSQWRNQETADKASFKSRFLVKKGADFLSVNAAEIAYFFTTHKIVFLTDKNGVKYLIDKPLFELESELDPGNFFRVNRKYLVNIEAIQKFKSDNGKIILTLLPDPDEMVTVSKENAPNFKKWIEG